ncbi:hypothetical protein Dda_2385 [Drechslerella dactyloides]|uniref:Uncharacterized protein n=1 Tax=Drechslerella dactyloides TaxID=74499 RepID=A0AAD6NNV2_DREDA|nr:hypothetical protein Dda_2385 [Drechslerella dactyloides]
MPFPGVACLNTQPSPVIGDCLQKTICAYAPDALNGTSWGAFAPNGTRLNRIWDSNYTPRALYYRGDQNLTLIDGKNRAPRYVIKAANNTTFRLNSITFSWPLTQDYDTIRFGIRRARSIVIRALLPPGHSSAQGVHTVLTIRQPLVGSVTKPPYETYTPNKIVLPQTPVVSSSPSTDMMPQMPKFSFTPTGTMLTWTDTTQASMTWTTTTSESSGTMPTLASHNTMVATQSTMMTSGDTTTMSSHNAMSSLESSTMTSGSTMSVSDGTLLRRAPASTTPSSMITDEHERHSSATSRAPDSTPTTPLTNIPKEVSMLSGAIEASFSTATSESSSTMPTPSIPVPILPGTVPAMPPPPVIYPYLDGVADVRAYFRHVFPMDSNSSGGDPWDGIVGIEISAYSSIVDENEDLVKSQNTTWQNPGWRNTTRTHTMEPVQLAAGEFFIRDINVTASVASGACVN